MPALVPLGIAAGIAILAYGAYYYRRSRSDPGEPSDDEAER